VVKELLCKNHVSMMHWSRTDYKSVIHDLQLHVVHLLTGGE